MYHPRPASRWLRRMTLGLTLLLAWPVQRGVAADAPVPVSTNTPTAISTNLPAAQAAPTRTTAHTSPRSTTSSSSGGIYLSDIGSVDSAEAAVVVFVVASVVVVSAAVIYTGALLANLILQPEQTETWAELTPRAHFFSGGHQQGAMSGLALSLGLAGDYANVGLVVEGGYLDADVITLDETEVEVASGYGLGGLSIRWPFDSGSEATEFEAELLVGSAREYDLISRASFALTWSVRGPWRAGLRLGALYLDVEEREGPVWQAGEDFNLLGGVETSIRF